MNSESDNQVTFTFRSGHETEMVFDNPLLVVRLDIDPESEESGDDKFRLYSSDGAYDKVLTVADDQVPGDGFLDLCFDNLKVGLKYTLEVDEGTGGQKYNVFEEVPYRELIEYYSELESGDDLGDPESSQEDESDDSSDDDFDWTDEGSGSQSPSVGGSVTQVDTQTLSQRPAATSEVQSDDDADAVDGDVWEMRVDPEE